MCPILKQTGKVSFPEKPLRAPYDMSDQWAGLHSDLACTISSNHCTRTSMPTVLIVEDNLSFSEMLRSALQAQFPCLRLAQAAGVREALCSIESLQPDLIISDLGLPDGSGLELTRVIRAAEIQSAIIILTSHDLPEYREAALGSGANHFMTKGSFSLTDIFSVVRSVLPSTAGALAKTGTWQELTPRGSWPASPLRPSAPFPCGCARRIPPAWSR